MPKLTVNYVDVIGNGVLIIFETYEMLKQLVRMIYKTYHKIQNTE